MTLLLPEKVDELEELFKLEPYYVMLAPLYRGNELFPLKRGKIVKQEAQATWEIEGIVMCDGGRVIDSSNKEYVFTLSWPETAINGTLTLICHLSYLK
jgi:hypothetical protein